MKLEAIWTKKELRLLRKHYPMMPTPQLAAMLGRSGSSVRTKAGKLGIRKEIASNNPYTPEKKALLFQMYPNTTNREIAQILGVSECSVIAAGFRFKLRKTKAFLREHQEKGMYRKGQEPVNKGKKWSEFMSEEGMRNSSRTTYKKGQLPHNTKADGVVTIRNDKTGKRYQWIRVGLSNWKMLHVKVWEDQNGPVPKGKIIVFKDKDTMNCTIDNLECITRRENMLRNTVHNYPKEIASTIQLMGALKRKINRRQKQVNHGKK